MFENIALRGKLGAPLKTWRMLLNTVLGLSTNVFFYFLQYLFPLPLKPPPPHHSSHILDLSSFRS
jgi:hypothetical protein